MGLFFPQRDVAQIQLLKSSSARRGPAYRNKSFSHIHLNATGDVFHWKMCFPSSWLCLPCLHMQPILLAYEQENLKTCHGMPHLTRNLAWRQIRDVFLKAANS